MWHGGDGSEQGTNYVGTGSMKWSELVERAGLKGHRSGGGDPLVQQRGGGFA